MSLASSTPFPPKLINGYVWDSLQYLDNSLTPKYNGITPFFPISDTRADDWPWESSPYVIYDELIRMRSKPGYFVKKKQLLYVIKGTPTEVLAWTNAIEMILDRQDAAAQDVNAWAAQHFPQNPQVFFHWFKTMQIDAANENRMDISTNQKYLSTMIIEYEYHTIGTTKFD